MHRDHQAAAPAHSPHAGHVHAAGDFGAAFAFGITLNTAFVLLEALFGLWSGSTALIADAGHNLSDVLGLLAAWGAVLLGRRAPSRRFTYGLRASSILAALLNALLLLVAVGAVAWEAAGRILAPQPVAEITVMIVAAIGVVINGATAWLFASGRDDLNIRGAFLHMGADAAVSAGVVVAAAVMLLTGWLWVDPAVALAICAVIVWSTWGLLRDGVRLALYAVPAGVDPAAVRAFLTGLPGVARLHDLHIWGLSTSDTALSCHLVMPAGHPGDAFLLTIAREMAQRFGIGHCTIQIETAVDTACVLAPDEVI
jgi:cobalt-zinc-cadmium efflux system protein